MVNNCHMHLKTGITFVPNKGLGWPLYLSILVYMFFWYILPSSFIVIGAVQSISGSKFFCGHTVWIEKWSAQIFNFCNNYSICKRSHSTAMHTHVSGCGHEHPRFFFFFFCHYIPCFIQTLYRTHFRLQTNISQRAPWCSVLCMHSFSCQQMSIHIRVSIPLTLVIKSSMPSWPCVVRACVLCCLME